jgi:hypothetical protein
MATTRWNVTSDNRMFAHHYPTSPHFEHAPWIGVRPLVKLEEYDPAVVEQLNEMARSELVEVVGRVTLTTCATTATTYLACCPPSPVSVVAGVASAAFLWLPLTWLSAAERKKIWQIV